MNKDFVFYDVDTDRAEGLAPCLVSFADKFGLSGNIWQQWITYKVVMQENPLSIICERRKVDPDSSIIKMAERDFKSIYEIFNCDANGLDDEMYADVSGLFWDYKPPYAIDELNHAGKKIKELSDALSKAHSAQELGQIIVKHYEVSGAGIYGLFGGFRVSEDTGSLELIPVERGQGVGFDELIGCDEQTEILKENTEAFLSGRPSNNVLLYGDSGTGKSTSVRALIDEYSDRGLRLIELPKACRTRISEVLAVLKKRNYRFILFMDDLSFEEDESEYKELKAMLEGALESSSDNVLIYATSNRRHLIKETWADRNDMEYTEDIHRSDTMEEKLSLSGRFGVRIYYGKPDYKGYMHIVESLARRQGLKISDEELAAEARKWSLRHGSTSGRTASQLIKTLRK